MSEFEWNPKQLSNSFYRDYDIPPIYPVTPNINSIVQAIFDIPGTEVFNFCRTHIDFDIQLTLPVVGSGSGTSATGNQSFNYFGSTGAVLTGTASTASANSGSASGFVAANQLALHLGKIAPIQSIVFQTDSNIQLVNLTNPQQQSAIMVLPQTKLEDWADRDEAVQSNLLNASLNRSDIIAPVRKPCYQLSNIAGQQVKGNSVALIQDTSSPGGASLVIDATANGTPFPVPPGVGELAMATLISTRSTAQNTLCFRYRINLRDYKNTLFACDRDLFFNRRMRLVVNLDGYYHWGAQFTGATEASVVANGTLSLAGASDIPTGVNLSFQNLTLRLGLQSNESVASMVRQHVTSDGLRMLFPYTLCTNFTASTVSATTQQQFQVPINASLGQRLMRVYSAGFNGNNTGFAFCNPCNMGSVGTNGVNLLYSQIQTRLNARNLQDSPLDVTTYSDYRFMKDMLKGSAIINSEQHQLASFFVDNFTSAIHSSEWDEHNTDLGGLNLKRPDGSSVDYTYTLLINNLNANAVYYVFSVVQREMVITKDNVLML
jgi:hypothetical protein